MTVSIDCDSIYGHFNNWDDLDDLFGESAIYRLSSTSSRITATTKSRYSVDVSLIEEESIFIRNNIAKLIPMYMFPNIRFCKLMVGNFELYVNLFFLGPTSVQKSGKFTNVMLATFNMALNMARIEGKRDLSINVCERDCIQKLAIFKVHRGGPKPKNEESEMNAKSMKSFVECFFLSLLAIPELNIDDSRFEKLSGFPEIINPPQDSSKIPTVESIQLFAEKLAKKYCFVVSAAGIKNRYAASKYCLDTSMGELSSAAGTARINQVVSVIVDDIQQKLGINEDIYHSKFLNLDIGVQIYCQQSHLLLNHNLLKEKVCELSTLGRDVFTQTNEPEIIENDIAVALRDSEEYTEADIALQEDDNTSVTDDNEESKFADDIAADIGLMAWPHPLSKNDFGGVSTGAVMLIMRRGIENNGTVYLSNSRQNYAIQGMQCYMPFLKNILEKGSMSPTQVMRLKSLPGDLQRLLSGTGWTKNTIKKIKFCDHIIERIQILASKVKTLSIYLKTIQNCPARFELYILFDMANSLSFRSAVPNNMLDPNCFMKVDSNSFNSYMIHWSEMWMKPLEHIFENEADKHAGENLSDYSSSFSSDVKTALVFCAEQMVQLFEIPFFEGRITKAITSILLMGGSRYGPFFEIPMRVRTTISEEQKRKTLLHFGLNPLLLGVRLAPQTLDHIKRPTSRDINIRKLPDYIQHGVTNGSYDVNCPVAFQKALGEIFSILHRIEYQQKFHRLTAPDEDEGDIELKVVLQADFGYFDNPDYGHIGKNATVTEHRSIIVIFAKLLAVTYDKEWHSIIKAMNKRIRKKKIQAATSTEEIDKLYKEIKADKLENFPTTKQSLCKYVYDLTSAVISSDTARETATPMEKITSLDALIKNCFGNDGDIGIHTPPTWEKSVSRRVYLVMKRIMARLERAKTSNEQEEENHFFTSFTFKKELAKTFTDFRRLDADSSAAIVWKSNNLLHHQKWRTTRKNLFSNVLPIAPLELCIGENVFADEIAHENQDEPNDNFPLRSFLLKVKQSARLLDRLTKNGKYGINVKTIIYIRFLEFCKQIWGMKISTVPSIGILPEQFFAIRTSGGLRFSYFFRDKGQMFDGFPPKKVLENL